MEARGLELLAPARNAEIAREAIVHGADAVYIGGPSHGARASAANSIDDIRRLTDFAHVYGAKVYVTLNTIIYDHELAEVERDIRRLYEAGADALIVQDLAILEMDIPPIDLHASTQCDIRTPQKAEFLARCGFSQLVVPREFSLSEIEAVREAVGERARLEAFVHGALCVCYSGDCQAGWDAMRRSANRGECPQMCRLPYTLTDADGRPLITDRYLLSLRDLNRLADIGRMADAGISSFKIEGRLKDAAYVKTAVAAYRRAIDRVIEANPGAYRRTSFGSSDITINADVNKTFNRGFTPYFIDGRPAAPAKMANHLSPKWTGEKVAEVVGSDGNAIIARATATINNGDGLGYFDADGRFRGFHLNTCDPYGGKPSMVRLAPASPLKLPTHTILYRNRDVKFDAMMERTTASRTIPVDAVLTLTGGCLSLRLKAEAAEATATAEVDVQPARQPQTEARRKALSKFGGTPFRLASLSDEAGRDVFVPLSALNSLRQQAVAALEQALRCLPRRLRNPMDDPVSPHKSLTYHDNVSNRLAEKFYRDHGATDIERALEVTDRKADVVMTTRYCLRRELGACLLEKDAAALPSPLFLTAPAARYRLDFDCANCRMKVIKY